MGCSKYPKLHSKTVFLALYLLEVFSFFLFQNSGLSLVYGFKSYFELDVILMDPTIDAK
jgi:hypothetical protein